MPITTRQTLVIMTGVVAALMMIPISNADAAGGFGFHVRGGIFRVTSVSEGEDAMEIKGVNVEDTAIIGLTSQWKLGPKLRMGAEVNAGGDGRGGMLYTGLRTDGALRLGRLELLAGTGFGFGGGELYDCRGMYEGPFLYVEPGLGAQLNFNHVAFGVRASYWQPIITQADNEGLDDTPSFGHFGITWEVMWGRFRPRQRPVTVVAASSGQPVELDRDNDLSGTDLHGQNLAKADLRNAMLAGADLSEADLRRANLKGANLEGANLKGANLARARLKRANLVGANLQEANLVNADLRGADLQGANLNEANLNGARLKGANLDGAMLGASPEREAE